MTGPVIGSTPGRMPGAVHSERGSTLLLTIFYGFLALAVILLVTAASSLYLERKRLFTLADGAALAGAEAFELAAVAPTDAGLRLDLDSSRVRTAVYDFVARPSDHPFEDLRVERASSPDGRGASVTLSSYWRPPMVTVLVPQGIRIEVTAAARSVFF